MARVVKVKCDGRISHVNEVDLYKALETVPVAKSASPSAAHPSLSIPDRVVLKCKECSRGKVRMTREMIEKWLNQ